MKRILGSFPRSVVRTRIRTRNLHTNSPMENNTLIDDKATENNAPINDKEGTGKLDLGHFNYTRPYRRRHNEFNTDFQNGSFINLATKVVEFFSASFAASLNYFGYQSTTNSPLPKKDENQESAGVIHKMLSEKSMKALASQEYIENIKAAYKIYEDCYNHLELAEKAPDIGTMAHNNQLSGGYKPDMHEEATLFNVRKALEVPDHRSLTLLNLVIDPDKNINSTILLHMLKDLLTHPGYAKVEDKEKIGRFIQMLRLVFPERLNAELETQGVAENVIDKLMESTLACEDLLKLWQENIDKIKLPLAHTQWCTFPYGLRTGKIEDYYNFLQIAEHPTLGRKPSLLFMVVPREYESSIKVAFSQALANEDKGVGGTYQIFVKEVSMLFLLHVAPHRLIYQNDQDAEYSYHKISDRDEHGNNIISFEDDNDQQGVIHLPPPSATAAIEEEGEKRSRYSLT
jgi:hypothetical protein